jgi:hypothetical protein
MLRRMAARLGVHAALLAGAALVAAPLFLSGTWHDSHEGVRYLVLADLFVRALHDGIAYPRFLPDLYGGYGYPTFCFYQPGFFWVVGLFATLPLALHHALHLAIGFLLYAGALGAFRLGELLANRRYGFFAAALFLLTPYLFVDLYVRGDLTEAMGLLLGPWVLVGLFDLERRLARGAPPAPAMLGLAASVAALVVAHPAPPVALLPAAAATAVALAWRTPHGRALALRAAASLGAGIALAAPYWASMLALRGSVGFDRLVGGFYTPEDHGVAAWQLVARTWGFGGSTPGADDGMSLQLGAVHLALAVGGAIAGRRARPVAAAAVAYALLVLLVLDVASPFWAHAGPLRFLQFPWRLLAATATLQLVLAVGLRAWTASLAPRAEGALLAGLALVAAGWCANQFSAVVGTADPLEILRNYHEHVKREDFVSFAFRDEFTPRSAQRRPERPRDPDAPAVRLEGRGRVRSLPGASPHRVRVELKTAAPASAVIEQLYLPGWKVALDGREIPREALERSLTAEGFARVALPGPGRHRLEATYGGPPGAGGRAAGMLAALGVFAALLRRPRGPLAPTGGDVAAPSHSTTKRFGEPSG